MRKTRSSRCSSSRSAWLSASRYVMTGMGTSGGSGGGVGEDVLVQRLERGLGAGVGEVPRVLDDRLDLVVERVHLVVGDLPGVLHVGAQQRDRVALEVLVELRLRAVGAAHRVG